jgi:hypothetical protein
VTTKLDFRDLPRRAILTTLVSVLAPAVAAALGTTPATLGISFWLSGYLVLCWAGVSGLFAERPAQFQYDFGVFGVSLDGLTSCRGGVPLWDLPPIYPRNIPVFLGLFGVAGLWTVFGVFVALPSVLITPTALAVVLGFLVLLAAQLLVEINSVYVAKRQYSAISANSPVRRALELLAAAAVLVALTRVETDSQTQLSILTAGLWGGYVLVRQHPGRFDHFTGRIASFLGIVSEPSPAPEPISHPDGEPNTTATTSSVAVQRGAVRATVTSDALLPFWIFVFGVFLVAAVFAASNGGIGVAASTLAPLVIVGPVVAVTLVPLKLIEYLIANATIEYRVYDNELVAYDTRLSAVQWRLSTSAIHSISVTGDTVEVKTREETRTLHHVAEPDSLDAALHAPRADH